MSRNTTEITKVITMDCGHRLSNYEGKCRRIHGHTYKLEVTVGGELNRQGMIIDFGELKEILKEKIEDKFDHRLILMKDDPVNLAFSQNVPAKDWIVWVDYNPTAENMAQDVFSVLTEEFKRINIKVCRLKLWETPTSYAEIRN